MNFRFRKPGGRERQRVDGAIPHDSFSVRQATILTQPK